MAEGSKNISLIPRDEISVLKSASEVKSVAQAAPLDQEKLSVARAINDAANCGNYKVVYQHKMSDELIEQLEGMGYKVYNKNTPTGTPFSYIISWA